MSLRLQIVLPLVLAASQWLGGSSHASPPVAPKRTPLTRVRIAHEMVTTHQRDLPETEVSDGSKISARALRDGSRVNMEFKNGLEAEFKLDARGRVQRLVLMLGRELLDYQSVGELKRADGSDVTAMVEVSPAEYRVRMLFDHPIEANERVTVVLGPRDQWTPSSPTLERHAFGKGQDWTEELFPRDEIVARFGRRPLAAYLRIEGPKGKEHINVDGKPGANFPVGD